MTLWARLVAWWTTPAPRMRTDDAPSRREVDAAAARANRVARRLEIQAALFARRAPRIRFGAEEEEDRGDG